MLGTIKASPWILCLVFSNSFFALIGISLAAPFRSRESDGSQFVIPHRPCKPWNEAQDLPQKTQDSAKALRAAAGASITAFPSVLDNSGWVEIKWQGLPVHFEPHSFWVGIFLEGEDINSTAPVKFQYTGFTDKGSMRFWLLNLRWTYVAYLLHGPLQQPTVISRSNAITVLRPNAPMQGHIALTGTAGEMRVSWATGPAFQQQQRVEFGRASGELTDSVFSDAPRTYTRDDMCGGDAATVGYRHPGVFHSAVIQGLQPGETIYYRYGSVTDGFSDEYWFRTDPGPVAGEVHKMLVFGDLGQDSIDGARQHCYCHASRATTDSLLRELPPAARPPPPRRPTGAAASGGGGGRGGAGGGSGGEEATAALVLHIGDISYARGFVAEWDSFMDQIGPVARRAAWMTGIGNHERDWPGTGSAQGYRDSGGECGLPYTLHFPMPPPTPTPPPHASNPPHFAAPPARAPAAAGTAAAAGGGVGEAPPWAGDGGGRVGDTPWYSFEFGPIHVTVLSSEHPPAAQTAWLRDTLAARNRTRTPWAVVGAHRPLYLSCLNLEHDQDVATELRVAWEGVLLEGGVDLFVAGHHHSYQRTCPVFESQCRPAGTAPVHLVAGMAGYRLSPTIDPARAGLFEAIDGQHHGYGRLTAGAAALRWEYVRADTAEVLDTLEIPRRGPPPPQPPHGAGSGRRI